MTDKKWQTDNNGYNVDLVIQCHSIRRFRLSADQKNGGKQKQKKENHENNIVWIKASG